MTTLTTSIVIAAPIDKVFYALVDLDNYTKWHPSIKKIDGCMEQDQWLNAYFGNAKRSVKIPILVTVLLNNKKLEWQGSLFKKGMFRKYFLVRHAFYVEDIGDGKTRFTNEEEFSSLLSLLVKRLEEKLLKGYSQVNIALKTYCEL